MRGEAAASVQNARARVRDYCGDDTVDRIARLDASVRTKKTDIQLAAPDAGTAFDFDVVFAGGGLSLLVAAEAARHGLRVGVFDRDVAGRVHREWNASAPELEPLVTSGIVTAEQLKALTIAHYRTGFCQFHGGEKQPVRGVLDRAIDAGPFLAHVRAVCEARGVRIFDRHALSGLGAGPHGVTARFESENGRSEVTSRLVVDARGAASPYASADIVCPTVGGVLRGIVRGRGPQEIDADVGEILVTTEGIEDGVQHVWEAFPAHPGETTVYLFYYDGAGFDRGPAPLLSLYDRFFRTLPRYKRGDIQVARPTFGYIPGWSRTVPGPRAPHPRILLSGDAAARHSPLTFCGFGAMLRSFMPAGARLAELAGQNVVNDECIMHDHLTHRFTGTLAKLMASRTLKGDELNLLLDAAFGVLVEMGNERYAALLHDRLPARDFYDYITRTAGRVPAVYKHVFRGLGIVDSSLWAMSLAGHAALGH